MNVDIRPACYGDIAPLAAVLDGEAFFSERLERQKDGRGVLFVAWLGDVPVGDVYLWLENAEEYQLRRLLPGVALLTHLEVRPEFRDRGIGTRLVAAVETYLFERGHRCVALAVRDDNHMAARLYRRLGYADWGHGRQICLADSTHPNGQPTLVPELCYVMVKQLHSMSPSSDRTFSSLAT